MFQPSREPSPRLPRGEASASCVPSCSEGSDDGTSGAQATVTYTVSSSFATSIGLDIVSISVISSSLSIVSSLGCGYALS